MTDRLQIKQAKKSIPRYEVLDDSQTLSVIFDALNQIHHEEELLTYKNVDQFQDFINLNIIVKQFELLSIEAQQPAIKLIQSMNKAKYFKFVVESQSFLEQDSMFQIFQAIENFLQLEEIELDFDAQIQYNFLEKFGISLQNKSNLGKINIKVQKNIFGEDQFQHLMQGIAKLEQLQSLNLQLQFSDLAADGIFILSQNLKFLKNLRNLSLSLNTSSTYIQGFSQLFKIFQGLIMLESLKIKVTQPPFFSSEEIDLFVEGFKQLNQIQSLDLSNFFENVICDDEIRILEAIQEKQLKSISIHFGQMMNSNEKCKSVFGQFIQEIQRTKKHELQLGFSKAAYINLDFTQQIAQQIYHFQETKHLTLIFNGIFSMEGIKFLFASLSNLTCLETLKIEFSFILSPYNVSQLFLAIQQLVNLKKLDMKFTHLYSYKYNFNVIHPFYYLSNLTELICSFSQVDKAQILEFIFDGLQYLRQLKYFSLDLQFQGSYLNQRMFRLLTNSLSQLSQLKYLRFNILSYSFNDEEILINLFEQFGNLDKLEHIVFQLNIEYTIDIIKQFGRWLQKLNLLKYLDISFNTTVPIEQLQCLLSYLGLLNLTNLNLKFEALISNNIKDNFLETVFQPLNKLRILQVHTKTISDQTRNQYVIFMRAIKFLRNLQYLDLNLGTQYLIEEEATFQFKQCFSALKYLKELKIIAYFPYENMKQHGFQDFCISFSYLKELAILSGYFCFPNNIRSNIIQSFQSLKNLKELDLRFETFRNSGNNPYIGYALLDNSKQFSNLTKIEVKLNNQKSEYSLANFFKVLSNQKQLISFNFKIEEKYEVTNEEIEQLGKTLLNLTQLKQLECHLLSQCELEEETFLIFSKDLSQLKNLNKLTFITGYYTKIPTSGIDSIYQSVLNLDNLHFLRLDLYDKVNWTKKTVEQIKPTSVLLPLLELELTVTMKQELRDSIQDFLKYILTRSKNLQKLTISIQGQNFLFPCPLKKLAKYITQLHYLQHIQFHVREQDHHTVNDETIQKIIQSFYNLKYLHTIDYQVTSTIHVANLTFLSIKQLLVTQKNMKKLQINGCFDKLIPLEQINDFGAFIDGKQFTRVRISLSRSDDWYIFSLDMATSLNQIFDIRFLFKDQKLAVYLFMYEILKHIPKNISVEINFGSNTYDILKEDELSILQSQEKIIKAKKIVMNMCGFNLEEFHVLHPIIQSNHLQEIELCYDYHSYQVSEQELQHIFDYLMLIEKPIKLSLVLLLQNNQRIVFIRRLMTQLVKKLKQLRVFQLSLYYIPFPSKKGISEIRQMMMKTNQRLVDMKSKFDL
ncbi:hypothetical protein ABPG72_012416 [Tetrahymena utriculariae]